MKIALLLTGKVRTFSKTFQSISDNLINGLNPDIFISTSFEEKILDYLNLYKPIQYILLNDVILNNDIEKKYQNRIYPSHGHIFTRIYNMWYKNKYAFELLNDYCNINNIKYDCVIKFRPDCNIYNNIYSYLEKIKLNTVYTNHVDRNWVGDVFAFGDFNSMKNYFFLFNQF